GATRKCSMVASDVQPESIVAANAVQTHKPIDRRLGMTGILITTITAKAGADARTRTGTGLLPRDFKSLASTIPPRPRVGLSSPAGARRVSPRVGVSRYCANNLLQAGSQSLPLASTTRPS